MDERHNVLSVRISPRDEMLPATEAECEASSEHANAASDDKTSFRACEYGSESASSSVPFNAIINNSGRCADGCELSGCAAVKPLASIVLNRVQRFLP